jgi:hypothetical protein
VDLRIAGAKELVARPAALPLVRQGQRRPERVVPTQIPPDVFEFQGVRSTRATTGCSWLRVI